MSKVTANKRLSQDLNPGILALEPILQTLLYTEDVEKVTLEPGLGGKAVCKLEKRVMRVIVEETG